MPTPEIVSVTAGKRVGARDPQSAALMLLREIARRAAEGGADPSAVVRPDHELLGLCDQIVMLRRQAEEALEALRAAPFRSQESRDASDSVKRIARALRRPVLRVGTLRATSAVGLYAKAVAVSKAGACAAKLGRSLAFDLLACIELRAVLWPAVPGAGNSELSTGEPR
jgi:hypothetical protein